MGLTISKLPGKRENRISGRQPVDPGSAAQSGSNPLLKIRSDPDGIS